MRMLWGTEAVPRYLTSFWSSSVFRANSIRSSRSRDLLMLSGPSPDLASSSVYLEQELHLPGEPTIRLAVMVVGAA